MHPIDVSVISIYLLATFGVGLWSSRGVNSLSHFSVGTRNYGSWVIFATLSASFIGGGFTTGNAQKVFSVGIAGFMVLWGFSLKELFVARWLAPRMDQFDDAISVGDILQKSYGLPGKILSGLFGLVVCAGVIGASVGAMGYIFNVFLGLPHILGIFIGCGMVIIYSAVGGIRAVIYTDIIQFGVLLVGIPLTFFIGLTHIGGLEAVRQALPAGHLSPLGNLSALSFVSLFLTFLVGETLVPPYVQRLLIGETAEHTTRGTYWSGLLSIPFFAIAGGIGLVAYVLDPDLNPNMAIPYVVRTVLPVGIKGVVTAGMISVVMSSADSFLNSAAVGFVHDVVEPLMPRIHERRRLVLAKAVTVLVGILAMVFALCIQGILDTLVYAYNFWAPVLLVPLAGTLLGCRLPVWTLYVGVASGAGSLLAWNSLSPWAEQVDGLIVGVLCHLAVYCCLLGWDQREGDLKVRRPRLGTSG